jgi:CMP-N-acetylneuraminic acid synthetase
MKTIKTIMTNEDLMAIANNPSKYGSKKKVMNNGETLEIAFKIMLNRKYGLNIKEECLKTGKSWREEADVDELNMAVKSNRFALQSNIPYKLDEYELYNAIENFVDENKAGTFAYVTHERIFLKAYIMNREEAKNFFHYVCSCESAGKGKYKIRGKDEKNKTLNIIEWLKDRL